MNSKLKSECDELAYQVEFCDKSRLSDMFYEKLSPLFAEMAGSGSMKSAEEWTDSITVRLVKEAKDLSRDEFIAFLKEVQTNALQSERTARESAESRVKELESQIRATEQLCEIQGINQLRERVQLLETANKNANAMIGANTEELQNIIVNKSDELERVQKVARELKDRSEHSITCRHRFYVNLPCSCGLSELLQSAKEAGI